MADLFELTPDEVYDLKQLAKQLLKVEAVDKDILRRNLTHLLTAQPYITTNQANWWYKTAHLSQVEAPSSLTKLILE